LGVGLDGFESVEVGRRLVAGAVQAFPADSDATAVVAYSAW
jgi:hypothetical protein